MITDLDWTKVNQLIPAIIQDDRTGTVLMLGYMNEAAFQQTTATNKVTFFSRTKQRLWTKGETSGNFLNVVSITADCDRDTLLIRAIPEGPVCHLGSSTCFGEETAECWQFLAELEQVIKERKHADPASSYTAKLFAKGRDKIAQKVGEEGVEVVIASKNDSDPEFLGECADLVYHLTVLLADRDLGWSDVLTTLRMRDKRSARS
jgi:phosphoribosyl-ATP pyrophosphohydrolase/phosphoribosyl-AMP cyclohydrolase